jgi:DNA polymerase elongation subunit (family B)
MTVTEVLPPLYGVDIETDTTVDGLDPRVGRVLAVAVADDDGVEVLADDDEATLLRRLDAGLAARPAGVLVTWNGARFDLPYLASRAALRGVELGLELEVDGHRRDTRPPLPGHASAYRARWHDHAHLDVYRSYQADVGPVLGLSCTLKSVARLVGLEPLEVDASRVHTLGAPALGAYVASDAACTRELARRRWASAAPAIDVVARPRADRVLR